MAQIVSVQDNLQGPIQRNENLIDHYLFVTLVWGSVIGAIALFVWMFQAGAWSERVWPSAGLTAPAGQVWTPVQPVQPTRRPAVSIPAGPPQVTVNIPANIQVDATVRNVTASPSAPAPSRELTQEEKANQFWDRALRRDP